MNNFKTQGVCAKSISFKVEDNKVTNVQFISGCPGNLTGLEKLVEGMAVGDVVDRLKGIKCGQRATSCPDQLATALEEHL